MCSSPVIKNTKRNPNFENPLLFFDVVGVWLAPQIWCCIGWENTDQLCDLGRNPAHVKVELDTSTVQELTSNENFGNLTSNICEMRANFRAYLTGNITTDNASAKTCKLRILSDSASVCSIKMLAQFYATFVRCFCVEYYCKK
jgi:hypothetical protein